LSSSYLYIENNIAFIIRK